MDSQPSLDDVRYADAWGIERGYTDVHNAYHAASSQTIHSILSCMGARNDNGETIAEPIGLQDGGPVVTMRHGERTASPGDWHVLTENGDEFKGVDWLPADLPLGYHELSRDPGQPALLIVAPQQCPDVDDLRQWGWVIQLYSMRSSSSWGMGDLGDLKQFGAFAADKGADFIILNPLHASLPSIPQQPSPYYPSSKEFRNPLYLRVEDIPGATQACASIDRLARAGQNLNHDKRIDRDEIWRLKIDALRDIWKVTRGSSMLQRELDSYCDYQGEPLARYATFCALSKEHGRPWTQWPVQFRSPKSSAVVQYAFSHSDEVAFHQWLQMEIQRQLDRASDNIHLFYDLAVGVDPAGADAWLWQHCLALDARVGAPPDEFNTKGQDWSVPPFDPWRLRAARYEPFIRMIRSALNGASGLRIDHVMSLFRLFWIPKDASPRDGAYVRYPWNELLSIVALEAHRARAHVIGEDLGTVDKYMRDELAARNVLSYKTMFFEKSKPVTYPQKSFASVSTHDLPTIGGMWTGSDLANQRDLDLEPNVESTNEIHSRIADWTGASSDASVSEVVADVYAMMAEAPCAFVAASIEDALGVTERINFPGTTDQWPNWSVALPVQVENFASHEGIAAVEQAFSLNHSRAARD